VVTHIHDSPYAACTPVLPHRKDGVDSPDCNCMASHFFLWRHARGVGSSVRPYVLNQALPKKIKKIIHSSCARENEALVGRDENGRENLSGFCLY
jgi:hypothetical protein